ncbi:ketosynthase chain-length factor [Nocardia sp. NBC_01499]|uniref:beta-ketoacyl synthase N-terminal-like domain-containing protein n=1 Tax=Nocardia sp. NBC_01499 TaxID=2903597 RepID=UPI00386B555D
MITEDTPVITGIGVITPTGAGLTEFWESARSGRSGIKGITRFSVDKYPSRIGGQIDDFDPAAHIPSRLRPQTDRSTQLALVATDWALAAAEIDPTEFDEYAGSVVNANAIGGAEFIQNELFRLWRRGPEYVTAYMSYAWFHGVNTGQISIKNQLKGSAGVVVTGQAGGIDAVGQARRRLRSGQRFVVTGGADAPICPYGLVAGISGGYLSRSDDPAAAYRPFADKADGYVLGEGCAMMVLEPLGAAKSRNAKAIRAAITGYSSTFDPAPSTGKPSTLSVAARAAIADAGLTPDQIDVVFADGAGIATADAVEAAAIRELFGPHGVPVTVPKAATGRMYAAGSAVDIVAAVMAIEHNEIPPTVGTIEAAADYWIDLVTGTSRAVTVEHALVLAHDENGFNAALVVSAC